VKRKRKHIPLREQLAAALSMLLPQGVRDLMRTARFSASAVIREFEMHHNILHAHDGPDRWWNLTPMLKPEHRETARRDTSIVAKVKRITAKLPGMGPRKRKRPRRKLRSRGFDKSRSRKFSGQVVPRDR